MQNVLVIGAPRSGTTLVAGLLSSDERVCPMLPECSFMTQVIAQYFSILHFSDPGRFAVYATSETRLTEMYQPLIRSMLETVSKQFDDTKYQYLVLKDPELTQYVDLIPKFFGADSKIVHVVRDPRAVIASMLSVEKKKKRKARQALTQEFSLQNLAEYLKALYRPMVIVRKFYGYYSAVHESGLKQQGKLLSVSYEKIIRRDEAEFRRLEDYLGFRVSRVGFEKIYVDFDRADPTYSAGYGKGIQSDKDIGTNKPSWFQNREVRKLFSELNRQYLWW